MPYTQPIEIFIGYTPLPFEEPSKEIFNGFITAVQHINIFPILISAFIALIFVASIRKHIGEQFFSNLSLVMIYLISIMTSFKVCEGYDELFINLRHSLVLRDAGYYSFNFAHMQEGTVDFLPLFLTGLLGKIGFPLIETLITMTLLGNVLLITVGWLISKNLTRSNFFSLVVAFCIGILPCVVYVGATGFTATLYTAIILYIFYCVFLLKEPRTKTIVTLTSLLTLIRIEGIAIALFLWIYLFVIKERANYKTKPLLQVRRAVGYGILLSAPFFISCAVRYIYFGWPIPVPVIYKNGQGNIHYLLYGLKEFIKIFPGHNITLYVALALYPGYWCFKKGVLNNNVFWILGITFISSLMYTTGGGDWFPSYWGRYYMPFIVSIVIIALSITFYTIKNLIHQKWLRYILSLLIIVSPYLVGHLANPNQKSIDYLHLNAFKKLNMDITENRNRWERIDRLGLAGKFLKLTTPDDISIASSELATIMYYANRDIVGLLGTTNPDVATSPINSRDIRGADLLHRRRAPETLIKNRAEIIAFGEIGIPLERAQFDTYEKEVPEILNNFLKFQNSPLFILTAYYRAGSFEYLSALGYRYFVVSTPNIFFFYMVHESIYNEHIKKLRDLNIHKAADSSFQFSLPQEFTDHFPSGKEYL